MLLTQFCMIFVVQNKVSSNHHINQAIYFDDLFPINYSKKIYSNCTVKGQDLFRNSC